MFLFCSIFFLNLFLRFETLCFILVSGSDRSRRYLWEDTASTLVRSTKVAGKLFLEGKVQVIAMAFTLFKTSSMATPSMWSIPFYMTSTRAKRLFLTLFAIALSRRTNIMRKLLFFKNDSIVVKKFKTKEKMVRFINKKKLTTFVYDGWWYEHI